MKLVAKVEKVVWNEFVSYKNVGNYIEKWHIHDKQNYNWETFSLVIKNDKSSDRFFKPKFMYSDPIKIRTFAVLILSLLWK